MAGRGVIALDARIRVAAAGGSASARLAIRPYPSELEEPVEHHGRGLVLRPIRPEDTPLHRRFLAQIKPQDLYLRFFTGVRERSAGGALPHAGRTSTVLRS